MKRITFIIIFTFISLVSFSQNRQGNIFYSEVEKTDSIYKINVDLFEIGKVNYIKVELVDEHKTELASNLAEILLKEDGKYYLKYNDKETRVFIENINLTLKNEHNDIKYPQINIKVLDKNLSPLDYSQKVFY